MSTAGKLAVALLVALAAAEVIGRVLVPFDPESRARRAAGGDPRSELPYLAEEVLLDLHRMEQAYVPYLGWLGKPNQRLPTLSTNELGFRDATVEARAKGELRVLLLGGSVAWGWGASSNAATPAGVLQVRAAEPPGAGRVRVMSAGYPAWTSREELIVWLELQDVFDPDVVIALTGFNDLATLHQRGAANLVDRPEARTLARAVEEHQQPMGTLAALRRLGQSTGVGRLVARWRTRGASGEALPRVEPDPAVVGRIRQIVTRYETLASSCARRGADFAIALHPDLFSTGKPLTPEEQAILDARVARIGGVDETFPLYRARLLRELGRLEESGVTLLDLGGVFDDVTEPLFIDGSHFVDAGIERVAEALLGLVRP